MIASRTSNPCTGLPKQVYALFAANTAASLGNFVWPMLTLLLSGRLGLERPITGFFVTLSMLAMVPGSLIGGKLADRFGRREVFVVFRVLTAIVTAACVWHGGLNSSARAIPWLLIAASVFRGAAEPMLIALTADLAPDRDRQAAFSLMYMGNRVGFASPVVAGLLFRQHLAWVFGGYALATLLSAAIVAVFVPRTGCRESRISASESANNEKAAVTQSTLSMLLQRPILLGVASLLAIYSAVHVQHLFSLPIAIDRWYGSGGARLYGALITLNALVVVLLTPALAALTSGLSTTRNLALGGLLYAAGFGLIGLTHTLIGLIISTVIWTLGEILVVADSQAYMFDCTPASYRGRVSAVIPLLSQAGYALAPWVTGWLIERAGLPAVWPACFAAALFAAVAVGATEHSKAPGIHGASGA